MALFNKEKILSLIAGGITTVVYGIIKNRYKEWESGSNAVEDFLVFITFGTYHRNKRKRLAAAKKDAAAAVERNRIAYEKERLDDEVHEILGYIGAQFGFNRASVTTYEKFDPTKTRFTLEEIEKMLISVPHEWKDRSTNSIKAEFQKHSNKLFADAAYELQNNGKGWIEIPDKNIGRMINAWGVERSFRILLNSTLVKGTLNLSWMNKSSAARVITPDDIEIFIITAKKIGSMINV